MSLTLVTRASSRRLVSVSRARLALSLDPAQDDELARKVDGASTEVERYCGRLFAREEVTELVRGYGGLLLRLRRRPVLRVSAVLSNGEVIADFTIDDEGAGALYRQKGWEWTTQPGYLLDQYREPEREEPSYSVTYIAGYLLPEDTVVHAALAVAAAAQTLTLTGRTWPLLIPGDVVTLQGFTGAANSGPVTVATRTPTVLTISGAALTEEPATQDQKTVLVQTLPSDLEDAALELVQGAWVARGRDPSVVSQRVGPVAVEYGQPSGEGPPQLPYRVAARLAAWREFQVA